MRPGETCDPTTATRRALRHLARRHLTLSAEIDKLTCDLDRQANNALWTIAMVRLSCHPDTRAYAERRTKEGLSRPTSPAASSDTSPASSSPSSSPTSTTSPP